MKTASETVCLSDGPVKSQIVRAPDGAMRLILNASRSSHARSSRFLSEFFGSGVRHIAFETNGIFAAARTSRANGVALPDIPENYHNALEARSILSGEEIDRPKALGIPRDREEDTDYFQVRAHSFEGRFFFEIARRRRGYDGFAAASAPISLAAQTRLASSPG